eukprot:9491147-Pyramimonas_sp.AAC.3
MLCPSSSDWSPPRVYPLVPPPIGPAPGISSGLARMLCLEPRVTTCLWSLFVARCPAAARVLPLADWLISTTWAACHLPGGRHPWIDTSD